MMKLLDKKVHPLDSASFASKLAFSWIIQTLKKGWKEELCQEDLCGIVPDGFHTHKVSKTLTRCLVGSEGDAGVRTITIKSLVSALFLISRQHLIKSFIICLIQEWILKPAHPLLFALFLSEMQKGAGYDSQKASIYAVTVCGVFLMHPIAFTHSRYLNDKAGIKIRNALCSIIYRKIIRISHVGFASTSNGEIMNLLTNDVNRFDQNFNDVNYVIAAPIQCIIIGIIFWRLVGPLSLLGIAVIVLLIPLQMFIGKVVYSIRKKALAATDRRVKLMDEIIGAMKIIKLYAWEDYFSDRLATKRKQEYYLLRKIAINQAAVKMCYMNMIKIAILFVILGFMFNKPIDMSPSRIYLPITMLYSVRYSLSYFFAIGVTSLANITASLKRIVKFLNLDEYPEEHFKEHRFTFSKAKVLFCNVTASWNVLEDVFCRVNFKLKNDDLLCVIGTVGSGKSSLLKAVLKEINITNGDVVVNGSVAFVSQEPWVFSDTVKNNILFGRPYNTYKFQRILDACDLNRDIAIFPDNYNTLVGERGVHLSGGQRARLSLARAMYQDADIYLLDDPLSAVDPEVGNHLYTECIQKYLAKKIRILVTHQINYLRNAPKILLLKKNKELVCGTYEQLLQAEPELATYFSETTEEKNQLRKIYTTTLLNNCVLNGRTTQRKQVVSTKNVSVNTYIDFLRSAGNVGFIVLALIVLNLSFGCIFLSIDYWIKIWSDLSMMKTTHKLAQSSNASYSSSLKSSKMAPDVFNVNAVNDWFYFEVLVSLTGLSVVTYAPAIFFTVLIAVKASRKLHNSMFYRLLHAPMKFFNSNPNGDILNKFTKDMGHIDDLVPSKFEELITGVVSLFLSLIIIFILNYYLLLVSIALLLPLVIVGKIYIRCYTTLKRMENITRSPVFTHISITLDGLTTIRASRATSQFQATFNRLQDENMALWFMLTSVQKWFALIGEFTGSILVCAAVILQLFLPSSNVSAGSMGFLITQLVVLAGNIHERISTFSELQNLFTSVERVLRYGQIESEASWMSTEDHRPPKNWPTHGRIDVTNLSLIYDKRNGKILHDLTFTIKASQKIGIVGRTGAGKSSLINAIFRLTEPEGSMKIDGVEITKMGLHDLRKKLAIIPQEALIFKDSVRYNLDPFNEHQEDQLWMALDDVCLKSVIKKFPDGLETQLNNGGCSLSVGQSQLICLARAILRQNKILLLDEATSNVDVSTDDVIQKTIRSKFSDCTVLIIAHRLNTIIDANMIMVIDNGRILEFDSPKNLVTNNSSHFYKMIMETGSAAGALIAQAMENQKNKLHL